MRIGVGIRTDGGNGRRRGGGAVDPFAAYYGTGPGQMSFDLPLHDTSYMTMDGSGYVSAVQHIGGGGAFFDVSAAAGQQPQWDGASGLIFDGVDDFFSFANAPDLNGVHFIAAAKRIGVDTGNIATPLRIFNQTGDITARAQFTTTGINHYPGAFSWPLNEWAIIESRLSENTHTMWYNGGVIGTMAVTQVATPVNHLGRGSHESLYRFPGALGRMVAVVTDTGFSKDSPEPAVLAARDWLATKYGITLP